MSTTLDKAVAKGVKVVLMDNNIPNWQEPDSALRRPTISKRQIAGAHLKTVLKDGDTLGILEGVPGVPPSMTA